MRLLSRSSPAARGLVLATVTLFAQAAPGQHADVDSGALIDRYCTSCHNSTDWAGSLDLQGATAGLG